MQFGNLTYIHGIWVVIAVAGFLFWAFRKKQTVLQLFVQNEMLKKMTNHVNVHSQHIKAVLILASLLFIVFALMEPKWGYKWETVKRKGNDVIVAVDVSRSMLAQDVKPNRLDKAKREILDLINMMQGDRIGLIAFAGSAFVQCPLTLDYGACKMFVNDLNPQLIPRGGTRIGETIRKAIDAFEGNLKKHRALILITDGEDHEEEALTAAKLAREKGIKIYCIGIGTPEGSPIQVFDAKGKMKYLKDSSGQVILSKLNDEMLKDIALETGGAYVPASSTGLELDLIYKNRIAKMDGRELESSKKKRYEHRFQWPLAVAAIFLIFDILKTDRKK